jgi:hypothetical protein
LKGPDTNDIRFIGSANQLDRDTNISGNPDLLGLAF